MIYSAWILYKTLNAGQWILCRRRNGGKKNLYQLNFFNHLYNFYVLIRAGIMNISQHKQNEICHAFQISQLPFLTGWYTHTQNQIKNTLFQPGTSGLQGSSRFMQFWCQQYSAKKWSWNTVYGYIHQNCPGSLLNLQFLDAPPHLHHTHDSRPLGEKRQPGNLHI